VKIKITSGIAMAVLLQTLFVGTTRADSQVSITGKVSPGTCEVTRPIVAWDPMSAADIRAHGRISRSTKFFDLGFSGCVGVSSASITFGSVSDRDPIEKDTFRNTASTPAPHLSIWIQRTDTSGNCPAHYSTFVPGSPFTWAIGSADQVMKLCATYWNTGSNNVTAGDVSATIAVSVAYH